MTVAYSICVFVGVLPPVHLSSSGHGSGLHSNIGMSYVTSDLRAPDKEAHSVTLSALPARTHERVAVRGINLQHNSICPSVALEYRGELIHEYLDTLYTDKMYKSCLTVNICKIQREVVSLEASRTFLRRPA